MMCCKLGIQNTPAMLFHPYIGNKTVPLITHTFFKLHSPSRTYQNKIQLYDKVTLSNTSHVKNIFFIWRFFSKQVRVRRVPTQLCFDRLLGVVLVCDWLVKLDAPTTKPVSRSFGFRARPAPLHIQFWKPLFIAHAQTPFWRSGGLVLCVWERARVTFDKL